MPQRNAWECGLAFSATVTVLLLIGAGRAAAEPTTLDWSGSAEVEDDGLRERIMRSYRR